MSNSDVCPVCGRPARRLLIDFGAAPQSGRFLRRVDEGVPRRRLAFHYCTYCAFVGQQSSARVDADYTEVTRATSRQLPDYADEVSRQLRHGSGWEKRLIIEVGANDGTFLGFLGRSGHQHRLAIEPSKTLAQSCASSGHPVENLHLNATTALEMRARHGAAHTVVCRHTLEHVPDPLQFLTAMRILVDIGGLLFIEVPAISPILERLRAFELWDEHISYFATHTLHRLVSKAGFSILRMQERVHRGSANILCWATASGGQTTAGNVEAPKSEVQRCERFAGRWHAYSEFAERQLRNGPLPVFAIGASHPQSNYLNFSGLGRWVEAMVDDDPQKIGRYVALPKPTPVITTAALAERADTGTVLMTGFGYPEWMASIRKRLASRAVRFVDPLDDLARY